MIALPTTSSPVECAGRRHHLVWQAGCLIAADHPDPERELALTALGGESYRCLQLLQVWEQHADDIDVLLLAARGPADRITTARTEYQQYRHGRRHASRFGWSSYSSMTAVSSASSSSVSTAPAANPLTLRDILQLGGGLPDRLVAHVVDAWSTRLTSGDDEAEKARPRLQAALYGRFAAVARQWLGDSGLRVELTMTAPETPAVVRRAGDRVQAQLPFAWLAEVWSPGFAIVADRLCISAQRIEAHRYDLITVERDLDTSVRITLEIHEPTAPTSR